MTSKRKPQGDRKARAKPAPGPQTSAALEQARTKHDGLPLRPFFELAEGADGTPQLASPHSDEAGHSAWAISSLGTRSPSFFMEQMKSIEVATKGRFAGSGPDALGFNAALALICGIDPQDEMEGALATQMVGCHALSMEMLCRAKTTENVDHLQLYGNLAVKLQRTFTAQIEALARLRGKGQQTVRVEHVTVHPGAQAIVGDVHHHSPGGPGAQARNEVPPRAPTDTTSRTPGGAALPGPDAQGLGVPVPSDAERPMPAPRRVVARRAAGKSERA